jgi:hypothetical protein
MEIYFQGDEIILKRLPLPKREEPKQIRWGYDRINFGQAVYASSQGEEFLKNEDCMRALSLKTNEEVLAMLPSDLREMLSPKKN